MVTPMVIVHYILTICGFLEWSMTAAKEASWMAAEGNTYCAYKNRYLEGSWDYTDWEISSIYIVL